jgi:hypothetical protein
MMFAAGEKRAAPTGSRNQQQGKKNSQNSATKADVDTTPVRHKAAGVVVSVHVSAGVQVTSKVGVDTSNYRRKSTEWKNKT